MNNRGVTAIYGNYPPAAKASFIPASSNDILGTIKQLQKHNLNVANYGNPCEEYLFALDGETELLNEDFQNQDIGLWSEAISDENGVFSEPVRVEFTSAKRFDIKGLTFSFDEFNGVYATEMRVEWYNGDELLAEETCFPNSAKIVVEKSVNLFDKMIVSVASINMPNNRLRISGIEFGFSLKFSSDKIKNASVIQEIDPISANLSINTADFKIVVDDESKVLWQKRQPFFLYFNGKLVSTTFVKSAKRDTRTDWSIETEDYIGLLDTIPFSGGVYDGWFTRDLIGSIFDVAQIPYTLQEDLGGIRLYGYIPYTTCREALMQVCFALGAVADTSGREFVDVYALSSDISQFVGLDRIMTDPRYEQEDVVTAVEVTAHRYSKSQENMELYHGDETKETETVIFSEPMHSLTIEGGGSISAFGDNYAVLSGVTKDTVLSGKRYMVSKNILRKENPNISGGDIENVISINDATLVSSHNVDKLLDLCYNYYAKAFYAEMRIAERRFQRSFFSKVKYGEKKYGSFKYGITEEKKLTVDNPISVGQKIRYETQFLGDIEGTVVSQRYNLNGGIIVKDCVVR